MSLPPFADAPYAGVHHDYLENELGVRTHSSSRIVTIEAADELDRRHLDLRGLECVGVVEALGFDASGTPFEYTLSHHVPQTFGFVSVAQRFPLRT